MTDLELVIFDCDGVLVESERITNRVFCSMLNELGLDLTLQDMFQHFVGYSMDQCMRIVNEMLGEPPPDDFVPEFKQRAARALQSELTPVDGIEFVLESLDVPYCVASSGHHDKIRHSLNTTGLLDYFEGATFSVTDVENPKPAPDVFLLAAREHDVAPEACVVVEDTPVGVRGGMEAGMQVYGFSAYMPEHRLRKAGAHRVFSDMEQLPGLLEESNRSGSP